VQVEGLLKLKFVCRSNEMDESLMSIVDTKAFTELEEHYSNYSFYWDNVKFQLVINWGSLTQIIISSYDTNGPFYKEIDGEMYKAIAGLKDEGIFAPIELPISLRFTGEVNIYSQINAVKKSLFDLFFISNLGVPGILDFCSAEIILGTQTEKLKLSRFYFEESLRFKEKGMFPYSTCYSLKESKAWFDKLDIAHKFESDLPIERAIFSFLHICMMNFDISMVTWIFHALESIYGTNSGRGFNDMSSQIFFLLKMPERKQKGFKKKLRELNDLRSSFVHGGYKVPHPLNDDINEQMYELTNFGVVLIICSLQQLMKNNWSGLKVSEVYEGNMCEHS
jgi:hypothetical protein